MTGKHAEPSTLDEVVDNVTDAAGTVVNAVTGNDSNDPEQNFDSSYVQQTIIPMLMSNKVYDVLKWVMQYILPALAVGYFMIAEIWGLPFAAEVVATVTAVDLVLGIVLGISTSQYRKYLKSLKK